METHISLAQALIIAILQGVTELFPVSSLGHAVLLPRLLGLNVDQESPSFLPLLVMLHLGTASALLVYFWRDWWALMDGVLNGRGPRASERRYVLFLLILATIPAGLLGLLLEKRLATLFARPQVVALFLVLNGLLLFVGEWLRRRDQFGSLAQLRGWQAVSIGLSQAIALLPGFSRSGATMVGGLLVGLTHDAAAHFGFLLATPIILAAGLLEVPKLLRPEARPDLATALVSGVVAGAVAYLSTAVLMRYFKTHEANALVPFGAYCIVLGIVGFVWR